MRGEDTDAHQLSLCLHLKRVYHLRQPLPQVFYALIIRVRGIQD